MYLYPFAFGATQPSKSKEERSALATSPDEKPQAKAEG